MNLQNMLNVQRNYAKLGGSIRTLMILCENQMNPFIINKI